MATPSPLRIHPIPLELAWQNPQANWEKMRSVMETALAVSQAPPIPSRPLFVFPELTLTGFTTENPGSIALAAENPIHAEIRDFARSHKVGIIYGYPETQSNGRVRNILSAVGSDGKELAHYAKLHLFTSGTPAEVNTYEAGDSPVRFEFEGWRIGLGICFDLRFPELFRSYAANGCDLLILSACWLGGPTKSDQFRILCRAQAILTQSYFVGLNRSGKDPFANYEGEALAYGPRGEILLETTGRTPSVLLPGEHLEPARKLPILPSLRTSYSFPSKV
jgi:predicted amidohydrolase